MTPRESGLKQRIEKLIGDSEGETYMELFLTELEKTIAEGKQLISFAGQVKKMMEIIKLEPGEAYRKGVNDVLKALDSEEKG